MRCARLKLWSISAGVSRAGGAGEGVFTLQCEGDGLLELLQFFRQRQVALRRHALARHGGTAPWGCVSGAVVGDSIALEINARTDANTLARKQPQAPPKASPPLLVPPRRCSRH
jgi:hypothetical protein